METFIELCLDGDSEKQELLIAELSELKFDNFTQEEYCVKAYALLPNYLMVAAEVAEVVRKYDSKFISEKEIENDINWNEKWEENFEPIIIGNEIYVRALFHQGRGEFKHQIIIQPKMSFGTGHHETTQLMMELMLEQDFSHSACLDMGCGTGVLAILAEQLGSQFTIAVDYDLWCFENTKENFESNRIERATVLLGDVKVLSETKFLEPWLKYNSRIILSNITKNYNMENLGMYHNISQPGTVILLSGFYENDLQDLRNEAENHGMKFVESKSKNNWCAALFLQN